MLSHVGKKIIMFEGDTGRLDMNLSGDVQPTDVLEFRIKENLDDENCVFTQQDTDITDGLFTLIITQADTVNLPANGKKDKKYFWGVKIYRNNVEIDTIDTKNPFIVKKGV